VTAFHRFFLLGVLCSVMLLAVAVAVVRLWLVQAPGDRYRSGVFEFSLPKGWMCEQAGTETVCRPPGEQPHDAICILTMKFRGPEDTLASYRAHLVTPKTVADKGGTEHSSTVVSVTTREIGGFRWVEGVHDGSELANYRTWYLAAVTPEIGILVTFSAHRERIEKHRPAFERMIETLQAYR
jgi:hypothetical protein